MPQVPTVAETGLAGYEVTAWNGVAGPKGTPPEVIDILNQAVRQVLAMPDVKSKFEQAGVRTMASTAAELMLRLTADIKKWNDVVDKAGIARK